MSIQPLNSPVIITYNIWSLINCHVNFSLIFVQILPLGVFFCLSRAFLSLKQFIRIELRIVYVIKLNCKVLSKNFVLCFCKIYSDVFCDFLETISSRL